MPQIITFRHPVRLAEDGVCKIELRPDLNHSAIAGQNNVPTPVIRGVVPGFSLPIWDSNNEQLFFDICVPDRWNGVSDIDIHIHGYLTDAQPTTARAFKLQIGWEHYDATAVVPDTENLVAVETEMNAETAINTSFQVIFTGANTINYDIDGAGNELAIDENLCLRLRRIAKTGANNEITGEFVVTHIGLIFTRDKIGTAV